MFCLSSVNAPVLFQENERVKSQKQASKLQKPQQKDDNQEGEGEEKAELAVNVSAICFSCYLLHYLRAIIAHFLLRPVWRQNKRREPRAKFGSNASCAPHLVSCECGSSGVKRAGG